jgi:hypothetical protein
MGRGGARRAAPDAGSAQAPEHVLRHALLLRLSGIRGAMKRLEHRSYLEPGGSVDR